MLKQPNNSRVIIGSLLGLAAGFALGWALQPREGVGGGPKPIARDIDLSAITTELRTISENLELLANQPAPYSPRTSQPKPMTVPPVNPTAAELAEAIGDLLGRSPAQAGLRQESQPTADDVAITLASLVEASANSNATRGTELFGLSPADVLSLLGRPDSAGSESGETTWAYNDPGEHVRWLYVIFADGYVINTRTIE